MMKTKKKPIFLEKDKLGVLTTNKEICSFYDHEKTCSIPLEGKNYKNNLKTLLNETKIFNSKKKVNKTASYFNKEYKAAITNGSQGNFDNNPELEKKILGQIQEETEIKELFDSPIVTKTQKDIEKIEKDIEKIETELFKGLPEELKYLGWKLTSYGSEILIPYSENIYWTCRVNLERKNDKKVKKWIISWKKFTENENYPIGTEFPSNIFINMTDPKIDKNIGNRNKVMGYVTKQYELPRSYEKVREYWDFQVSYLNKYQIEQLLLDNFENQDQIEELEESEPEKRYEYETFEDYPGLVQEEAREINKSGLLLDNLVDSTNITHQGDETQIKNDFYSYSSLFLNKPVHKFNNGETGTGKSHLENETLAHIPNQYVQRFKEFSPKNIYYKSEQLHPVYNILAFDDYKPNEENTETVKTLADNETKPKTLETVSVDRDAQSLIIDGYVLTRLNSAKQLSDIELLNRFFLDDTDNDEDHKKNVKNKTKTNEIADTNNSIILKQGRLVLKCAWQELIDKQVKVFNPYSLFLNVENINNRNIKGYMTYIETESFFKYYVRTKINGVVIGNFNDFNNIASRIHSESNKQNYKITSLQQEIIDLVPTYTYEDIEDIQIRALDNEDRVKDDIFTYQRLASITGAGKSTIQNAINGIKGSSMPSLLDLKFLIAKPLNPSKYKSAIFIGKMKNNEESLKCSSECNHVVYFENKLSFDTLNKKIGLVYSYINSLNILINTRTKNITHTFCENTSKPLNSYDKICNFLKQFIEAHESDLIKITENNLSSFSSMKFHFKELQKYQEKSVYKINFEQKSGKNKSSPKQLDSSLNEKQSSNISFKKDLNYINHDKNSNKDQRAEIHKIIYEKVKNESINDKEELIKSIEPFKDNNVDCIDIIKTELEYLENNKYIEIINGAYSETVILTNNFLNYYNMSLRHIVDS